MVSEGIVVVWVPYSVWWGGPMSESWRWPERPFKVIFDRYIIDLHGCKYLNLSVTICNNCQNC